MKSLKDVMIKAECLQFLFTAFNVQTVTADAEQLIIIYFTLIIYHHYLSIHSKAIKEITELI